MADFVVSVEQWVSQARDRATEAFRAIATDALARVKELTPVDTGYLRANFVDVLSADAIPKPSAAPSVGAEIANAKIGDTIFIVNPVEYARRIEYGFVGQDARGRNVNQVGRYMVTQTVAELPQIAQNVLQRFNP
jgi:hypothetical protein